MSDEQGWSAPEASTSSGDATRDALGEVSTGATGDADPTTDAGWGPPPGPLVPPGPAYPPPGQVPPGYPSPGDAVQGCPPPSSAPSTSPSPSPPAAPAQPGQPGGPWPQAGWTPPPLAPKPGIIPLRPLNLGAIWSGVMTAVRGNPAATIGLALVTTAVVLVPLTLIGVWLSTTLSGATSLDPTFDPALDGSAGQSGSADAFFGGEVASLVPTLAVYVTGLLLPLFMAVVIGQGVQGRRIGLGETARAARGRILPAVGVLLIIGLAAFAVIALLVGVVVAAWVGAGDGSSGGAVLVTILASVVAAVVFVLFSVRWGFAITIVVLEGVRPVHALRRSWQLTRRRGFWRIFGIRLLTGIVAAIAGSVITAPIGIVVGVLASGSVTSAAWMLVLLQAGTVLVQSVLTTPFSSGVDSLLYVDQRIRYEGLDVALLQQARQGQDAPVT
ncbi:hypothetical protein GCM10009868_20510 [Terrabacter aerolatus]|uniref:DUF7847 domain-containing protein n=1 Tax=Terrabacter aerolatus TaxID=422442 RepID=A0A512D6Y8_9MICO|nr:glycerophosphoryl diester phosphodiesterase membrane domain-containing protein [Terrabacter aerolatus]GEO32222.1 hypothetical protein TAE01_40320 [Terrabacter aerolatus]